MVRECTEMRNTDLIEKLQTRIGELDAREIEVGVLHDDGERVMARRETDGGNVGGRIQKMKKGGNLVTESHPTDGDPDLMNPTRNISLEDGENDHLGQTLMMKRRNVGIITESIDSVMEIEMIDTHIDVREGILVAAVRLKDQENDTVECRLETNTVRHLQTNHPLLALLLLTT